MTRAIEGIPGDLRTHKCGVWGIQEENTTRLRFEDSQLTTCFSKTDDGEKSHERGGVLGNLRVQRVK